MNFLVLKNDHHPIGPSTLQQNQIACVFIAAAIGLLQIPLTPSLPRSIGLLQAYSGVWRLQNLMETVNKTDAEKNCDICTGNVSIESCHTEGSEIDANALAAEIALDATLLYPSRSEQDFKRCSAPG